MLVLLLDLLSHDTLHVQSAVRLLPFRLLTLSRAEQVRVQVLVRNRLLVLEYSLLFFLEAILRGPVLGGVLFCDLLEGVVLLLLDPLFGLLRFPLRLLRPGLLQVGLRDHAVLSRAHIIF